MSLPRLNVRVPVERIGAIVGRGGTVKNRLESMFRVDLTIDGSTGDIHIQFDPSVTDQVAMEKLRSILNAIGLGFSPHKAMKLNDDDLYLEVVDLYELTGKGSGNLERVRGRIIGKRGRAWKTIEELSGTLLSVQGRYVGIIGTLEGDEAAKNAVTMLIKGRQHRTVFKYLENFRRELKRSRMEIWEEEFGPLAASSRKELQS